MNLPKIEKGIPMERTTQRAMYLKFLNNMAVGDSFEIRSSERGTWNRYIYKDVPDKDYIMRKQENNKIRIWRTK